LILFVELALSAGHGSASESFRKTWIPFAVFCFTGEGAPALVGKAYSNPCAGKIFFGLTSKRIAEIG